MLILLERNRNLYPIISIEGNQQTTDDRRGAGIYEKLQFTMENLQKKGIVFGASITVTSKNMQEVFDYSFAKKLADAGTKAIVYVEYVPVDAATVSLAPDDAMRIEMNRKMKELREKLSEVLFVSFPGDEKTSGGCLAAGRGFFHINAHGGAEPCPFSPYSDTNLKKVSLREALHSKLFHALQENGNLTETHVGGCVLFEQRETVESLLKK